jgi:hypothetical protein
VFAVFVVVVTNTSYTLFFSFVGFVRVCYVAHSNDITKYTYARARNNAVRSLLYIKSKQQRIKASFLVDYCW